MSATAQPALSSPKLILIVDDTPVNLGVISGALKDFYKTKVATNGERALALASADEKPDLILLDVMMPGMDGYEVCSRLKADPATCEIPVIFLTGQTSVEDETRGFEVGGVDYVHKPFSPAVVKARVRSHILLREARAQLAEQLHAINNELEVARQIQLSILPHSLPQLPARHAHGRCFRPRSSLRAHCLDAPGRAHCAGRPLLRARQSPAWAKSRALRQVHSQFRNGRLRLRGSREKSHALCRCRTPARSSVSQRHWEGRPSSREWFDSRNV